jgi:Fe-S-cluster-containing dehydrogenase component/DMSO reductase anchor subunit
VASDATLLETLLREQQDLSAVEEFSRLHDEGDLTLRATRYQRLLPASAPGAGQQYAFEVDLDRCSGCKACVTACHSQNGLDVQEAWRDVGLLIGGTSQSPVLQHVTTACHHCLTPACLNACPVNAYEKDPLTGIVRHLDDQCFGCQYCILACPYEVPKYHTGKGIVRKCDMCSTRLAAGEAPACVQACPNGAIAICVVNVQDVIEDLEAAAFLPAAPDPQITYPTTTFRTSRVFPRNTLPADYFQVNRQHPHLALVVMLVLTQLSVGAFGWGIALEWLTGEELVNPITSVQASVALAFGLLALAASTFHLGRPQYAFRAVLGIRHSWLSREIVAFGLFAVLACLYAAALLSPAATLLGAESIRWLGWSVLSMGAAAVFCSVMIYAFVQRELWAFSRSATRFMLTSLLLGLATVHVVLAVWPAFAGSEVALPIRQSFLRRMCWLFLGICFGKLVWELALLRHLLARAMTPLRRSALLTVRELATPAIARFGLGALGGIIGPALVLGKLSNAIDDGNGVELAVSSCVMFGATLAGELLERYLFFAAATAPRMPGGIR